MAKTLASLLLPLFVFSCSENSDTQVERATLRWYTPSQADAGRALFQAHCAECHGTEAEGASDWETPLADGTYPPPPLNGSAHAWHHPLTALRRTINIGTKQLGGNMPAFKDKLNNDELEAVIAFFQSHWSNQIYDNWLQRGGLQ